MLHLILKTQRYRNFLSIDFFWMEENRKYIYSHSVDGIKNHYLTVIIILHKVLIKGIYFSKAYNL